jgi:5-formyltetrahydrofolate cyclo-ligase
VTTSDRLKREKKAIRSALRTLRDGLSEQEREVRSLAIAGALLALPELRAGGTVMAFASFGSEVDTSPILDGLLADGRRVTLPRVEQGEIVPVVFDAGDPMRAAAFGMDEPTGEQTVSPKDLDVVVTPGLGFDRQGYRVGYGGGFYDRLFTRTRSDVAKVGICFATQLVGPLPHGGHDVPVDVIVTDAGVVRCR